MPLGVFPSSVFSDVSFSTLLFFHKLPWARNHTPLKATPGPEDGDVRELRPLLETRPAVCKDRLCSERETRTSSGRKTVVAAFRAAQTSSQPPFPLTIISYTFLTI